MFYTLNCHDYMLINIEKYSCLDDGKKLLRALNGKREGIRNTIVRGRDRTSSPLWKALEQNYAKDLTVSMLKLSL